MLYNQNKSCVKSCQTTLLYKNPLFSQKTHFFPACTLFYPIVLKRKIITATTYGLWWCPDRLYEGRSGAIPAVLLGKKETINEDADGATQQQQAYHGHANHPVVLPAATAGNTRGHTPEP